MTLPGKSKTIDEYSKIFAEVILEEYKSERLSFLTVISQTVRNQMPEKKEGKVTVFRYKAQH